MKNGQAPARLLKNEDVKAGIAKFNWYKNMITLEFKGTGFMDDLEEFIGLLYKASENGVFVHDGSKGFWTLAKNIWLYHMGCGSANIYIVEHVSMSYYNNVHKRIVAQGIFEEKAKGRDE